MYRKPAPRPFDDRKVRGWGRALRAARPRTHTFRRYNALWLALPVVTAVASLWFAWTMPTSLQLSCKRSPESSSRGACVLVGHHLLGRTTSEPIAGVSGHAEALLSDDAPPGPKLLIQTSTGPRWFDHPRAVEIGDSASAVMYGERGGPPVDVSFDQASLSLGALAFFVVSVLGGLAMARVRTTLAADIERGEVIIRARGAIGAGERVALDALDELAIESVDDSDFMKLRVGGTVLMETNGACEAARTFLLQAKHEHAGRVQVAAAELVPPARRP